MEKVVIVIILVSCAAWVLVQRIRQPMVPTEQEKQEAFRKKFEESGLAGKVLKWRGTDEDK